MGAGGRACSRSSGTRRARSPRPTTWRRFARSASAARRCRASRRSRTSRCARGRAARYRAPRSGSTAATVSSVREVGAPEGTLDRSRRPVLQPAGAPEVPEGRHGRDRAGLAAGRPSSRSAIRRSGSSLKSGGRPLLEAPPARLRRAVLPDLRRPADLVEVRKEAGGLEHPRASSPRSASRARRAGRSTSSSTAASSRTARSRTRSSRPTAWRRSRSAARKSTCSSSIAAGSRGRERHPTKAEVRFLEQVAGARGAAPRARRRARRTAERRSSSSRRPGLRRGRRTPASAGRFRASSAGAAVGQPVGRRASSSRSAAGLRLPTGSRRPDRPDQPGARIRADIRPMMPLGQFRNTFIIAVDDEGIAIIDQHVAHERILFEQVMERLTAGRLESQRLLTPIAAGAVAGAAQTLASARGDARAVRLRDRGASAATASGSRRVPALLDRRTVRSRGARGRRGSRRARRAPASKEALRQIAATMACHAAVKANSMRRIPGAGDSARAPRALGGPSGRPPRAPTSSKRSSPPASSSRATTTGSSSPPWWRPRC